MKIIAAGDREELFAVLTRDEFAQLDGYRSEWTRGQSRRRNRVDVGDEIDVGAWFKATQSIADNTAKLERARETFAEIVASLDQQLAALGPPEIES